MTSIVKLEARPGHRLFVSFSDGVSGEVELASRLFGPMFLPLADEAYFRQVRLDEFGAPTWPNGADLAPDALYRTLASRSARSPAHAADSAS